MKQCWIYLEVVGLRKMFIVLTALLLLIPLASGCGSKNETDTSAPPNQNVDSDSISLDARVEELAAGERVPGEVVVRLQGGITEEEGYQIFLSHDFERQSAEKQYSPQTYVLHFSEDTRDIKSVIRELMLDINVLDASSNIIFYLLDYWPNDDRFGDQWNLHS